MMTERSSELACVAVVVGGTGFWASAMRNAVIGLRVFASRGFELRLHGSADEVVAWLQRGRLSTELDLLFAHDPSCARRCHGT